MSARLDTARAAAVSRKLRAGGVAMPYAGETRDRDSIEVSGGFGSVSVRVLLPHLAARVTEVLTAAGYTVAETCRPGRLKITRGDW